MLGVGRSCSPINSRYLDLDLLQDDVFEKKTYGEVMPGS